MDQGLSQESILSTVNTLLGELEELKRKLATRDKQEMADVQSNTKVAELEMEVMNLRMENGQLSSMIASLKEQLKGEKEDSSDESYFPCVQNEILDGIVYVSNNDTDRCFISNPTTPSNNSYEKAPFILKTCSMNSCSLSAVGRYIMSTPSTLNVVRLCWDRGARPHRVLVLKKKGNPMATDVLLKIVSWLRDRDISVMVEPTVYKELQIDTVTTWDESERYEISSMVDFVITLGGDGTLLFASSLFPKTMPPVLSFHMGTLGFLTPFCANQFEEPLSRIIAGDVPLTIRNRLEYRIIRRDTPEKPKRGLSIDYFSDMVRAEPKLKILNDIVIDRGTSSSMVELNCYVDMSLITTVHADGLIIATPTGSTAYSMSAGGSMVHPLTPGMLMTPICPHTLSFRQMLFPDSTVLRIEVAMESRCPASVSFDGQFKEMLNHGDMLIIRTSKYPVPSVSPDESNNDWFRSVRDGLHWNKATSSIVATGKTS